MKALLALFIVLLATTQVRAQAACVDPKGKASTNTVKIDSAPQGAAIYINDKSCQTIGVTPWTGKLPKGQYNVIIEAPGYEPSTKSFTVINSRSQNQELFIPLVSQPKIDIRGDADKNVLGAEIWLDGVQHGNAPQTIATTVGRHQVELRKAGFESLSQWVDVTSGQTVTLALTLKEIPKPKYGSVVVDADVQDAEVYIDGNKNPDNTPTVIQNVVEGIHVIEVRKPPAPAAKYTIEVKANEQKKVHAELQSLINGGVGVVRVMSDTPGAHAFLDGTDMGEVPIDIKDVKVGQHVVQVKAANFKQETRDVTVAPGSSQIINVTLNPEVSQDQGTLNVISSEPGAEVFIDGASVGPAPFPKDPNHRIPAGEHIVVVQKEGFKKFEQKVRVEAGQSVSISAELKAVGRLRILSTPPQANVLINGLPSGKTPIDIEIETGETVVRLEAPGFKAVEQTITVESGKTAPLSIELPVAGPSQMELDAEQRSLSSFGARTLPRGRSTFDFDVGYPYYLNARITVGAGHISNFGFDANVAVRTMGARSELGLGGRIMLADAEPFSAAAMTELYYGSKLLDDSGRNGVTWDVGGVASLTALTHVTITGRAYLEVWSDRHCPALSNDPANKNGFENTAPLQVCIDYKNYLDNMTANDFDQRVSLEKITGLTGKDFFGRENGARLMLSIAAEVATQQNWSIYGILEGAPFQSERALFTNAFAHSMFDTDFNLYARVGATYKF